jgi:hypothetical protein
LIVNAAVFGNSIWHRIFAIDFVAASRTSHDFVISRTALGDYVPVSV